MRILVSGSSGLVGSGLVFDLRANGHQVIRLIREPKACSDDTIYWDPKKGIIPHQELEGYDAVIHLAGKNIAIRWTEAAKQEILSSRANDTHQLSDVLLKLSKPPKVFLCASAIGIYGNRKDEVLTENSSLGAGFLANVCREWESAAAVVRKRNIRCIHARFGIILSSKGGVLARMLPAFRLGLGAVLGDGSQEMSWIALEDVISALQHCLITENLEGGINFTAPNPQTNRTFSQKLSQALHRPLFLRIGEKPLHWLFGEMADELLLASAKVMPDKLLQSGYQFIYPTLDQFFKQLSF